MNFKRIQIIFLVTFIAIDVFLLGMLQQNMYMQSENVAQGDSDTTITKEMKNDEIKFDTFSNKTDDGYYISGTQTDDLRQRMGQLFNQTPHYENHSIESEFKQPISVEKKNPEKTINNLIQDPTFVAFGNQYTYSKDLSTDQTIVYVQKGPERGIYSDEAQIRFNLNANHQIVGYTQTYLNDIRTLREKSSTISERRALIWLYQYNEIPNNTTVAWTRLVYTKLITADEDRVFIPTWVIAIRPQNSPQVQLKRINAFTGGIIKETNQQV
ncbi:two-component system regulatory protein YycI [Lentilactobacillus sp. Marseille-Q4993]|uniref:two-component system regulatory protein YycI n=1 Tax=Lentilactobacillus sp. Marseille-Q4993 TaxID=3039492 RepID=UPI0024BC8D4E|nr:two-component system regulatory protein YycI [Lentilactobacillus sp. Marseille-Q4993]